MQVGRLEAPDSARGPGVARRALEFPLTRILVGAVVCMCAAQTANVLLRWLLGLTGLDVDVAKMIRVSLNLAAIITAYYWLFRFYERRKITELALPHLPREGAIGFAAAALVIALVVLVLLALGDYRPLAVNGSLFLQLYSLVIIATMAATEEVLMRGILYRITEASLGTNIALAVSGLAFGLGHLGNENVTWVSVILIALGGVLTGIAFTSSGRLWYPISMHVGWNYAQAFFGTTLSGMEEYASYGFVRSEMRGPELLTGGAFGPENSVITMSLLLILGIWTYSRMRKNGRVVPPFWRSRNRDHAAPATR